jgi:hypothetical protein
MTEPAASDVREPEIIMQVVVNERGERPNGLRILADGAVQQPTPDTPPIAGGERLDREGKIAWHTLKIIDSAALDRVRDAVRAADFAALPPQMLINYCKEDPGTAIWHVHIDGAHWRVLVWDPRPRRSPALDRLMAALVQIVGLMP